jgi:ABC-2 type transport system permease protein
MSDTLVGARPLLRASLRQEARSFAPWVVIVTVLSTSSVILYPIVFPTLAERERLAAALGANPALGLIFGPARDLSTVDGFNAWRSLALGGFLTALMAIFTVVKATRAQEDSGQAELLASGVLGRPARLVVAVAMASVGSVAVGVAAATVTILFGGDPGASLLLAATFTVTGWMFAAVASVAAQIASEARTASTIAVGTLGVLFVVRGYLYSMQAPDWTVWLTPQGWMQETAPASGNLWWPLLIGVVFAVAVLVVAFVLQARRDFGQGAVAPRPGPARGTVRNPLTLALRLNKGPLITWTVAFALLGVVFGYFTTSVTGLVGDNPMVQGLLASGASTPEALVASFLVTILSLVGIIAAVGGVQTMLKVRAEELDDRVEPVLAGSVRRQRFYGAHVIVALAGPAIGVMVAGAVVAAIAAAGDVGVSFGGALLQAVATVPATWTAIAVSVAVIGARPVVKLASWFGVLASFALTILGPTFGLDDWVLAISPFWHVPNVSAAAVDWSGLGWISLVTLGLLLVGTVGFRRRDLAVS